MKYRFLWLPLGILSFGLAFGQVADDSYIVELEGNPAAMSGRVRARREARRAEIRAEHRRMRAGLEQDGAEVLASVDTVANALIVRAKPSQAARLARRRGVKRVHPDRLNYLVLDRAVGLQRVLDAWTHIGGDANAGRGIKIGIIDTGIDAAHPGFIDPALTAPDGFPKVGKDTDQAFTNNKVIVARTYDSRPLASAGDVRGHGTSVAMVAAGIANSGPYGLISGVAPKAFLGSYKVFPDGQSGAPTSAILRALDDAVNDGMDIVNLSLGSLLAQRPANDIEVAAIERATNAGVIVVVAAGNDGPDLNTIGSPGTAPTAITVGNAFNDRVFAAQVIPEGGATIPATPGSGRNSRMPVRATLTDVSAIDQNGLACGELPADSLKGQVALILRGTCTFSEKLQIVQAAGAVAGLVYTDAARPDAIAMEVGESTLPATMVAYEDGINLKSMLRSGPFSVILTFQTAPVLVNASRLNSSTSRGPNTDSSIKPDLLAVGTAIYSASTTRNGAPGYGIASGTSLSSPMVAGAAAVLKAARPHLTGDQYRSLLVNSTTQFSVDSATVAVQQAGAGLLNLWAAVRNTAGATPVSLGLGVGGGTVDVTRKLTVHNLGSVPDTFTLDVTTLGDDPLPALAASSLQIEPGRSAEVDVRFRAASLRPGQYQGFVVIRGTQTEVESRVPYWYGVPSQTVKSITILEQDETGRIGTRRSIIFRPTDESGIPVTLQPQVTAVRGDGTVISVESVDGEFPGAYSALVRLGPAAGENVFQIEVGGKLQEVRITGN